MRNFFLLLLQLAMQLPLWSIAQQKAPTIPEIEKFVDNIPKNNTNSAKDIASTLSAYGYRNEAGLRGCFYWMMKNMKYDLKQRANLTDIQSNHAAVVKQVLSARATVCFGYAHLFQGLAHELGYRSYVVIGYVKLGEYLSDEGHAWVAIKMDTAWYLFDPTWTKRVVHDSAAGDIEYTYFKKQGEDFAKTHIPFDPMWQTHYYPITHKQFCTTSDIRGPRYFNYQDTLTNHFYRSEKQQYFDELGRIVTYDSEYTNYLLAGHILALEQQSNYQQARNLLEVYLKRCNPLFASADSLFSIGYKYGNLAIKYNPETGRNDISPSFTKYIDSSLVLLKQAADKMDEVVIPATPWRKYYYERQNYFRRQYEFYLYQKNEYLKSQ